jgi:hypothetical protein
LNNPDLQISHADPDPAKLMTRADPDQSPQHCILVEEQRKRVKKKGEELISGIQENNFKSASEKKKITN